MKKLALILLLVPSLAFGLANDKYGRAVTGPVTANGLDTYTDTDAGNSVTFQMSFPAGAPLGPVYQGLESQAPPNTFDYAGLDANSIVLQIYHRFTQAMMDSLVSGAVISSYAVLDPNFPPPPLGASFAGQGTGQGNFGIPGPYLPIAPPNWPGPAPVPNVVPQALDILAQRLATVNPTTPARALNSTFTPNATRPVYACYTIRVNCSITLGGTCTGNVQLLSDPATPPTVVRTQTQMNLGGTLVVGLTITNSQDVPLCYMVPTNHKVQLKSNAVAGSPTFSIVQQVEEMIH